VTAVITLVAAAAQQMELLLVLVVLAAAVQERDFIRVGHISLALAGWQILEAALVGPDTHLRVELQHRPMADQEL
jgi:hypothetical protein